MWKTLALTALLAATSCGAEAATRHRIVVTGSSTIAPVFAEIAKRFEARNPDVRIDVQTGGSSRGIADVRRGTAKIGLVSRDLDESEGDLRAWPIALDGLCLIVHRDNPTPTLSADQVRRLYRGEVESWSEVGGPDEPIVVVHKAEGRATLDLFLSFFELDNRSVQPDSIVGDNEQGILIVAGNRGAIGYVSVGAAAEHAAQHGAIRLLSHDSETPNPESMSTGRWPMLRGLNAVTLGPIDARTRDLLEFAQSTDVHDLIRALSLIPIDR